MKNDSFANTDLYSSTHIANTTKHHKVLNPSLIEETGYKDELNSSAELFLDSKYFFNRELSLLEFNHRVLLEAKNKKHPLLERLKFVVILSSNLDEFFMIRVAGLKGQLSEGILELSYDGKTPAKQLAEIRHKLLSLYSLQEQILMEEIFPEMTQNGINIHQGSHLIPQDLDFYEKVFTEQVLPLLTPLSLGPAHPFPRLINRSLNIAFVIKQHAHKEVERKLAFLQIPVNLPRFIELHNTNGHHFMLLEQIIIKFCSYLFPGLEVEAAVPFRVTRDADIEIAEDEAEDLLSEVEEQVKERLWGRAAVRLEVSADMPNYLIQLLTTTLGLQAEDVYTTKRPLNLPDFMQLTKLDMPHLRDKPFVSRNLAEFKGESNIFSAISKKDLMVHHPYDSFTNSTIKFIKSAAEDKDVLAIKITLYRVGGNSAVVEDLKNAAINGKSVTAFVELKARFDEENNIVWARELEKVGVNVIYGVIGLKTHCKIALVIRKENEKLKTYLHLSTGNYNQITSRLYTDLAIFTADPQFGSDAINLFNYLTGYSEYNDWKELVIAPTQLKNKLVKLINQVTEQHSEENPGIIIAKMNSLAHKEVINSLYKASCKGVKIILLVRGICVLKPGIKGVSENIEVRSTIGRFLEHSRIFYFKSGDKEDYFLSSADWMTRNLHTRVELMFPIYDLHLRRRIDRIFALYLKDTKQTWRLTENGEYVKIKAKNKRDDFSVQDHILEKVNSVRRNF